jgi:hypothetical protein
MSSLIYKEQIMTAHFVYIWFDKSRKMFYVGQHSGTYDDGYTTSSKWLRGEIKYRPYDFKRRIIKSFPTKNEAQKYEGYLLTLITESEWSLKYYNSKQGKPKGIKPWNAGKKQTPEHNQKISGARRGNRGATKGKPNPLAAENGKKGAAKLSKTVTGRKLATREDGTRYWIYPEAS